MRHAFIYFQLICLAFLVQNYALAYRSCSPIKIKHGFYDGNKYKCNDDSYYMFGDEVLECQEDGIWKGKVPYCVSPNTIKVWHDNKEHRNLHNKSNFICSESGIKDPWKINQYEKGSCVVKLAIKENSDSTKINIRVMKNKQRCENIKHNIKDKHFKIFIYKCKDETNEDIELYLDEEKWYEIRICRIQVYSEIDFHCDMNSLSILHGFYEPPVISATYGEHFSYFCEKGFQLKGNKYVYCGEERSKNDTRCEKKIPNNNLVIPVIISMSILLVVLLLGCYFFKKRKTRNQKHAENRKSDHIYSEPIYMDLESNSNFKDEPPPLPKLRHHKEEIIIDSNDVHQESENVHSELPENESQETKNTILKETEMISLPLSTDHINKTNDLYTCN